MNSGFQFEPFSKKQLKVLTWWTDASPYNSYDGIICDGAVRSGKTISMGISFIQWAMHSYSECDFALCGKTVGSLRRNVINTLKKQLEEIGFQYEEKRTENLLIITYNGKTNYFYEFGGRDESSQDLIQGMTLAGIMFDEVALMPYSFVSQGEARCSVEGAKIWYNCNPKSPNHWFKTDYIDMADSKRLLYLHFMMDDNLTLSDAVKERYRRMFTGVFYQRNVLGLWVTAEGRIYQSFTDKNILSAQEWAMTDENGWHKNALRKDIIYATIGVDFGGNKSSTAFTCTAFTKGFQQCIVVKEKRIKEEITPQQLEDYFSDFVAACRAEYPVREIFCDSAEQVLIRGIRSRLIRDKVPCPVRDALKGPIIDRIRFGLSMFEQLRFFILDTCSETIDAYNNAVWDDKHEDVRLDDGSTNIDNIDSCEYSQEKMMRTMIDLTR